MIMGTSVPDDPDSEAFHREGGLDDHKTVDAAGHQFLRDQGYEIGGRDDANDESRRRSGEMCRVASFLAVTPMIADIQETVNVEIISKDIRGEYVEISAFCPLPEACSYSRQQPEISA